MRHTRTLAVLGLALTANLPFVTGASAATGGDGTNTGKLVVSAWTSGPPTTFEVSPQSGEVARTLVTAALEGVLSPDGTKVAYAGDPACQDDSGCVFSPTSLMESSADGSDRVTVFTPGSDEAGFTSTGYPAWSPDGQHIAFDGTQGLGWIRSDGTGLEILAQGRRPAFSPDGTQLVYDQTVEYQGPAGEDEYGQDLFLLDLATRQSRQLTTDHQSTGNAPASWSPDGRRIVYPDGSGFDVLDPVTDQSTSVDLGLEEVAPVWSPDGTRIAYSAYDPDTDTGGLYVSDPDGRNTRRVGDRTGTLRQWVAH